MEVDFLSQRQPLGILVAAGEPEILVQLLEFLSAHFGEMMAENFFAGTIQENNASAHIRGDQPTAHRMNDVLGEIMKIKKFLALLLKSHTLAAKRLRQEAAQIGHREKPQKIHHQPGAQPRRRGEANRGWRDLPAVCQYCHGRKKKKTNRR